MFDVVLMGRTVYLDPSAQPGLEDEEVVFDALIRLGIQQLASCGFPAAAAAKGKWR